ncbi:MAG: DUF89 family protein [Pirellulales bacterium]|nr:DUF89 family protein [Pirellulales bacterium]
MKTFLDCIPCFIRQALDSARLAKVDEATQERLLRVALKASLEMDMSQTPPAMSQEMHRAIRAFSDNPDPYREVKDRSNALALQWRAALQGQIQEADDPLEAALRLAVAANVIDYGAKSYVSEDEIHESLMHGLSAPLDGDIENFRVAARRAERILYLADNAGEIVLDRLLIEQLPPGRVTVGVRGAPVINDATVDDALCAGIPEVASVLPNGSDAPGTILDDCSEAFRDAFFQADLVIAKGQGNYETLSDVDREIFFLLKAKCPVVARDLGCELGAIVLRQSGVPARASEQD